MIDPVADSMKAESWFSVLSKDGKKVFGIFNAAASGKFADKIMVIAHGLTGSPQDAMHQSARKYFNEHGYDVARIAFYNSDPDGRLLRDCTLQLHADDLNAVVDHFSGQYKKLFVAGHSYGGLSTLFANPDATAISFWDASFVPEFWKSEAKYVPELDCYKLGWGTEQLVGKAMVDEGNAIDEAKAVGLAKALKSPGQVILAGDNQENSNRALLFNSLNDPKEMHEIVGADHCFLRGNVVNTLLDRTYMWFERF